MRLADPARLQTAANDDAEFRMAARYWTATLALEAGGDALRVELDDGRVARCREAAPGEPATVTVTGPEAGWRELLAPVPRAFYQDLLGGCVQHHGFAVGGDLVAFSAYYQASQRLLALMRGLRAETR
jgi:hypothetical protein